MTTTSPDHPSFSCDLATHGSKEIELKSHYPIAAARRSHFDEDLFLFFPSQLGLAGGRYGPEHFLSDARAYTRLSTPALRLDEAIDPGNPESPVARTNRILAAGAQTHHHAESAIVYEIKTLCNVFRHETRERRHRLEEENSREAVAGHLEDIERFLSATRRFLDELHTHVGDPVLWADETISIKAEIEYYKLYRLADQSAGLEGLKPRLHTSMRRETEYRRHRGYESIIDPGDPRQNERVLYREGVLKKWSQTSLYLTTEERTSPSRFGHVAAAVAAAAAMAFAVAATIVANRYFPSNTVPWALLLVVTYIFKDRIKEMTRNSLAALVPRRAADESTKVIDPATGKRVGVTKGLTRMQPYHRVPEQIRHSREAVHQPFRDILPKDSVLHYHKRTRLRSARLAKMHLRTPAITEILRISIKSWLDRMDDPTNDVTWTEGDHPVRITADRVYHIHAIIELAHAKGTPPPNEHSISHYLIVATRNGILRIEEIADA